METQWMSIEGISKKYQIAEENLREVIAHGWVTYSKITHTWLIDEKSFLDYLELHRTQENRMQIIEKLDQLNAQLNYKLKICEEANATHAITNQLLPLFPLIIRSFMIYFHPGRLREVFLFSRHGRAGGRRIEKARLKYNNYTPCLQLCRKETQTEGLNTFQRGTPVPKLH